jgi:uncharacterized membrane protein
MPAQFKEFQMSIALLPGNGGASPAYGPPREGSQPQRWMWALMALASAGVALVSLRYVADVGPGAPPIIASNVFKNPWLALHAGFAALALLLGPFQFLPRLRAQRPQLHRWLGRSYVVACVAGGMAGGVLALGASTGPVSVAGFGLLALAWVGSTLMAWRRAVQGRIAAHRAWMVRSFALTLSAVTLRLYLPILVALMPLVEFVDGYRAIAFLCWVPNVLAAQWWLGRAGRKQGAGLLHH